MEDNSYKQIHIGIFDSGVGGLSVWKEILKLMPYARFSYVSDGAYCPYGPRPATEVIDRARAITRFLISIGSDIIVVACNTATAAAIDILRKEFDIPFVGMEPAVKPAILNSKSGVVGVLATKGTFGGRLYNNTLHKYALGVEVLEQTGDGLVELIERGEHEGNAVNILLRKYIDPMVKARADHIVLGCTHYPFLMREIEKIVGEKVVIVDPAPAVAKRLIELIQAKEKSAHLNEDTFCDIDFYSTASVEVLKKLARSILPGITDGQFFVVNI
jgi:glutamate racemase